MAHAASVALVFSISILAQQAPSPRPPEFKTEGSPSFAPDGKQVSFSATAGGPSQVYVAFVDGTGIRPITNVPAGVGRPRWSPDGREILFVSRDRTSEISFVDVATGNITHISAEAGVMTPDWSPDGREIVFSAGVRDLKNLHVMNRDGSHRRTLTTDASAVVNYSPAWVGNQIVFSPLRRPGAPDSTISLAIVSALGGNPRSLATTAGRAQSPAFCRDGKRIAFQGQVVLGNTDVVVINADGSGERRLTTDPGLDETPAWSPDGSTIAFQSNRTGAMKVYLMNADGSGVRRLTGR
jgi:TolB protein